MMFWKHISLCKDCSLYFSGFVAGLHPSLCLCWKMFRLSQNFLCTFMTFFIHGYMFASSSSACTFSLFDCSSVPFHILVCLFSICFSDVALFCGFYSRRTTLWPLRTCLILSRSVNFSRVHWRLVAGSGTLLDPLWRKVPKSISKAHVYLGSAESFEGDGTPVLFDPSRAQLVKHPTWDWHGWLSGKGVCEPPSM